MGQACRYKIFLEATTILAFLEISTGTVSKLFWSNKAYYWAVFNYVVYALKVDGNFVVGFLREGIMMKYKLPSNSGWSSYLNLWIAGIIGVWHQG